ncbi:DUF6624 domain-containing protein [uncultured Brevundimonas sp.]|uniref:DUF6624 domain-containing protein n=1 Tax=uncultured Brevundimonas sp. TaxID=213418 RepID=UPI0030EE473D|tara:strand:- start:800 stop:1525 length:726 start_codon:yes stop_codon:yes gene_type:complete
MKLLLLIAALMGGCAGEAPQQEPVAVEAPALSAEARALIAPVAAAIATEEARQAALPPPADVRERLERMGRLDQAGRMAGIAVDLSALPEGERQVAMAALWAPVTALDGRLTGELLPLVPEEGWFLPSVYGEQASSAAFLIIQHSTIEQWRRFVPVLEPLALAGEIDGQDFGLMYDRLAINEGRPQRYGTQMTCKAGKWVIDYANLEDPEHADERRADMGFHWTLAEYEDLFAHYPPCTED